jgi:steroid 5-alpha reductase family enzyme
MTAMIFLCSLWKTNSSAYDAYWSVFPFLLTLWLWFELAGGAWQLWQWATWLMVAAWSWRLTINWARGWSGWHHEDWRYVDFRTQHGRLFQLTNLFGIHLFPTAIVFVACLALFAVAGATSINPWFMPAGLLLGSVGIGLEYLADNQLHAFRRRPDPQPADLLQSGLWGLIRYPNYLGEMLFWWGVGLCGVGAGGAWWVLCGALAMMMMFLYATIPMKDKHMLSRYPDFAAYYARVPALLPRLQSNRGNTE